MARRKILFVCTGNTCRSPMAEAILRAEARRRGLDVEVGSAGIGAWPGDGPSPEAVRVMREDYGLDINGHRARRLTREMVAGADLILTMTRSHREHVLREAPEAAGKVFTLKEFASPGENQNQAADILDPLGHPLEVYRKCAAEMAGAIEAVVRRMEGGSA